MQQQVRAAGVSHHDNDDELIVIVKFVQSLKARI
jgi:hypothetical protein